MKGFIAPLADRNMFYESHFKLFTDIQASFLSSDVLKYNISLDLLAGCGSGLVQLV